MSGGSGTSTVYDVTEDIVIDLLTVKSTLSGKVL
jgi:hypothetical protein